MLKKGIFVLKKWFLPVKAESVYRKNTTSRSFINYPLILTPCIVLVFVLFLFSSCSSTQNRADEIAGTKEAAALSLPEESVSSEEIPGKKDSEADTSGLMIPSVAGECSAQEIEKLYLAAAGKKIIIDDKTYLPVSEGKELTFISGDFAGDGYCEFYVLYSEGSSEDDVLKLSITDLKNIYQDDVGLRQYLLAFFEFSNNDFTYKGYVRIESRGAFSSLEKKEIDKNKKISALSAEFITSEGTSEDLIVFSRDGKYSAITIKNTLSDSTRKDDIDNNGVLDLLRYEQIFVDGSGAETFITWFKFNGKEYLPVKTINTVRDLRSFLEKTELLLEGKELEKFIETAISPSVLKKLRSAGIGSMGILQRVFIPARRDTGSFADIETLLSSEAGIDFNFPVILENPFRMERDNLYSFTTYVRASLKGKEETEDNEAIYLVRIYMAANPFAARKYFYLVN